VIEWFPSDAMHPVLEGLFAVGGDPLLWLLVLAGVLLGTLNDLDYKLDRARYMLNNEDGKGCAATDTGRLDFSHVSAGSTRKIYFAQGDPVLPSGYVVPEKVEPETPEETADSSLTDEEAPQAAPAEDTTPEEIPLTDPARMTTNEDENPM